MKRRIAWKKLAYAVVFYVCIFLLSLYLTAYSVEVIGNRVGTILTMIGIVITGTGIAFAYVGNQEVDEPFSLWKDERVFASHRMLETISYPFHLEKPSVIRGHVSGRTGPYEFALAEFFGIHAREFQTRYAVRPKTYLRGKGLEKTDIGPLSLPRGTYVLWFGEYHEMDASFTLNGTYRKKPYENIYHLGLTLLQTGIPIFITGAILLVYGTLI